MKKSTKIKKLVKNSKKIVNNGKNLAMDLVRWIKPSRKDTLKYVLMFDFGYEENELIGLNCKEMSALIVALRAHQKMFKSTIELLEQDV
jgi:hypothetical protein